jgi:hypothetical protein
MIGIDGQYVFAFNLAGLTDFIEEEDLVKFTLSEAAGNVLPEFELVFKSFIDDGVIRLLNEGNDLNVTVGQGQSDAITSTLTTLGLVSQPAGANKRLIYIKGMLSAIPSIETSQPFMTGRTSAIEAMIAQAPTYGFTVDSNITKSADSQVWIQPNCTGKKFFNHLWLRADLGDSFPAIAIAVDGTLVIRDVKLDLNTIKPVSGKPYRWRFGRDNANSAVDVPIDGDPILEIKSGIVNTWVGSGREALVYDLAGGGQSVAMAFAVPLIAITDEMSARPEALRRFAGSAAVSDNVHPNYESSYRQNLASLASFSNVSQLITFKNLYQPVRVLDLATLRDDATQDASVSAESTSGLYYVAKVVRVLADRGLATTCVLARESTNSLLIG